MRILIVSALFPPDVLGGAEMSAFSLAQWQAAQGHDVAVLCTAQRDEDERFGDMVDGLKIYRLRWHRVYPMLQFSSAKAWQKPIWHLQDHLASANQRLTERVLDDFRPDIVNIHVLQGIGYNALTTFAKRDLPVAYCLHDMALACVKTSMFRGGHECERQCGTCLASSKLKSSFVSKVNRIGFYSPSRANLHKVAQFFPITRYPHTSILNPNHYPKATVSRQDSPHLRILYAGRLQETKGIGFLLQCVRRLFQRLGDTHPFHFRVIGSGPQEQALRAEFGTEHWCSFPGFVTQAELSNEMVNSDILCVPSVWFENSPGVLVHALGLGLPALGSNTGGMPELIEHEKNGQLLPVGDASSWESALEHLLTHRERLTEWRKYALTQTNKFDQDYLGKRTLSFFEAVIKGERWDEAASALVTS